MPKPTGEGAALLKAICDNPEEDTPRLVYADWLDEQGGDANVARAEFIRIQVAEEAKGEVHLNERPRTPREDELFRKWCMSPEWDVEISRYTGVSVHVHHYDRGFPYHVYAKSVRSFLKAAPDLYSRIPATWVRFSTFTPRTAIELAKSPFMNRIRYLDQLNGIGDEELEGLATSPHLGNLTRVDFGGGLTARGMRPFLRNPSLTRMKTFRPGSCWKVGPDMLPMVLECASAPVLEDVSLRSMHLTADSGPHLLALLRLPKLVRLDLDGNQMDDDLGKLLAGIERTKPLSVNLGFNQFTDVTGDAFLTGSLFRSQIVRANLHGNQFSDEMKAKLKNRFGL
ncbi:MAG: TIGR02996 domain-containing protein [Planctomycetes bacterium]|nr:TIGR02996 domain-containing protein [Planctomycetota bacterium]